MKKDLDKKYVNQILEIIIQYVRKIDQKKIKEYIAKSSYSDEKEFKRIVSFLSGLVDILATLVSINFSRAFT